MQGFQKYLLDYGMSRLVYYNVPFQVVVLGMVLGYIHGIRIQIYEIVGS